MRFASLPADQRPRERLLARGVDSLNLQELLALQLRSGLRGSSASDLAESLIAEFGGLKRLTNASVEELSQVPGIGEAKAASIVAGFELSRRAAQLSDDTPILTRASDIASLAANQIGHCRRERVLVFVLNRERRLLKSVALSEGSDRRSLIEVRDVLNAVLRNDGAAFALAHNHPSGDPAPSAADIQVTADVWSGAKVVGLRFLGHVIVAAENWEEVRIRPDQRRLD